jgi:ABC-type transport system involved in multi-copper enzyme maturation permease subunit
MIWGIARYEMKLQLRSLVFWLALVLVGLMFKSELWDEPSRAVQHAQSYQQDPVKYLQYVKNPESVKAEIEQFLIEGFPSGAAADKWADRMQITFAFATLFAAAFVFERDRLSKSHEAVVTRPVSSRDYLIGKWLGVTLPVLGAAFISVLAAIGCHIYIQGMLGTPWSIWPFFKTFFVLMVPTVAYSAAVVLALTAWLPRAVIAIPLFLIYEVVGGVAPIRPRGTFDITMFVARTEGMDGWLWTDGLSMLLLNRLTYVALTALLLLLSARLYGRRLRRGEAA